MNPNNPPLFNINELNTLRETHRNLLNEMLEKRYTQFVEQAVMFYAADIRRNHDLIMKDLQTEMNSVPHAKEFWSKARSFYSYKYNVGANRINTHEERFGDTKRGYASMYCIWCYTNFRNRLLEELKLDSRVFSFKLVSQNIREVDVGVTEFYNTIMLIYKP
jgi:hypothetical protein